jgi:hypothetical protein
VKCSEISAGQFDLTLLATHGGGIGFRFQINEIELLGPVRSAEVSALNVTRIE